MADIQQLQSPLKPEHIVEIVFRQRWLIIVPICIALTVGLYFTFTLPRTYSAATTILVQAQKVPGNYVRSIVSSNLSERISTISQQIMSQTNLEKIIDQFGLYEDPSAQNMYLEDKIKNLRKRIDVKLSRARSGTDAFTISFKGKEPDRVMRIANTLASFFMDENLKMREAQAVGTSEFLDSELDKTRKRLEEREKALSDYRTRYLGGLPDELETNLRTLDRLQEQLNLRQDALKEAKNTMNVLNTQIAQSQEMAFQSFDDQFSFDDFEEQDPVLESEAAQKLKQAEKAYENILLRYTPKHPDAIKIAKTIEKLKKTVENEQKAFDEAEGADNEPEGEAPPDGADQATPPDTLQNGVENEPSSPFGGGNWAVMQQEMQLNQVKSEIEKIESDITKIEEQMQIYQQRVEDTPKREQELLSLKRDYGNIQDVYSSLLNRKLEAELSVNMEKKQKGEQFRILDHARLPERPISPDVKKLLIFSLAAGLACGGGIVFLLEILEGTIRRDDDIEKKMGVPVIASIPPLKKPGDRTKRRLEWLLFSGSAVYAMMMLAIFLIVNKKGIEKVVEYIKAFV